MDFHIPASRSAWTECHNSFHMSVACVCRAYDILDGSWAAVMAAAFGAVTKQVVLLMDGSSRRSEEKRRLEAAVVIDRRLRLLPGPVGH